LSFTTFRKTLCAREGQTKYGRWKAGVPPFRNTKWQKIEGIKLANVFGIKNAPAGFLNWAIQNGAVSTESDTEWQALLARE